MVFCFTIQIYFHHTIYGATVDFWWNKCELWIFSLNTVNTSLYFIVWGNCWFLMKLFYKQGLMTKTLGFCFTTHNYLHHTFDVATVGSLWNNCKLWIVLLRIVIWYFSTLSFIQLYKATVDPWWNILEIKSGNKNSVGKTPFWRKILILYLIEFTN